MGAAFLIIAWVICAVAGWQLGRYKGYPVAGLIIGIIGSILGLVILALWPKSRAAKVRDAVKAQSVQAEAARKRAELAGMEKLVPPEPRYAAPPSFTRPDDEPDWSQLKG